MQTTLLDGDLCKLRVTLDGNKNNLSSFGFKVSDGGRERSGIIDKRHLRTGKCDQRSFMVAKHPGDLRNNLH